MNHGTRVHYHTVLWPAACRAQKWNVRDQEVRQAVTIECMRQVGGPLVTTSDALFGPDETTALFTYLEHLGDPASFDKSAQWDRCKADYRTFNRARNADWHERQAYGENGSKKLQRDRFARKRTAAQGPLDDLDPEEVRKRNMTFAKRHREKVRAEKKVAPAAPVPAGSPAAGVILLPWTPAEEDYGDEPAYVAPTGNEVPF